MTQVMLPVGCALVVAFGGSECRKQKYEPGRHGARIEHPIASLFYEPALV